MEAVFLIISLLGGLFPIESTEAANTSIQEDILGM
jgi:hypothetical protein